MRKIYVEKNNDSHRPYHVGDYDVMYQPWRVMSFHTQSFAKALEAKLSTEQFNDYDIGHVLRVRDSLNKGA